MDRNFLAGGAVLLVALSAATEVGELDARCVVRSAGDLAPGCDDRSAPHSRTVFAVSVANSTSSGPVHSISISFTEAEDAAERPDRRAPHFTYVDPATFDFTLQQRALRSTTPRPPTRS
jgi:hypothetical protein